MEKVTKILSIIFLTIFAQQLSARTLQVTNMADFGKQGQLRVEQIEAQGARKELGTLDGADEDYRYQTKEWQVPSEPFAIRFEYVNKQRWPGMSELKIERGAAPIIVKVDTPHSVRRLQ